MDAFLTVLLVCLVYPVICLLVAVIRALFSKTGKRKQYFRETFWSFFLEILNPLNWF